MALDCIVWRCLRSIENHNNLMNNDIRLSGKQIKYIKIRKQVIALSSQRKDF